MPGFAISGGDGPNAKAEFLRSHRWKITKLGPIKFDNNENLYAKSLKLPSVSFDIEQFSAGSSATYKFAKTIVVGDIVVAFYDIAGLYDKLLEWQKKIWNKDTGLRPANAYMDTCTFVVGDELDNVDIGYTIKAFNCWPKSIDHSQLAYDRSDLKTVSVTLVCTHIDVAEENNNQGPSGVQFR